MQFLNIKIYVLMILFLNSGCSNSTQSSQGEKSKAKTAGTKESSAISYAKDDLKKIKWIEGKWKGIDGQNPFYEIYWFINDSTLMITSYDWNGKDSSNSSADFVRWKGDGYYLGNNQNWKVFSISDTVIKMMPVKASNEITWKFKNALSWDAILVSKKEIKAYHMQRFDPFKK